MSVAGGDDNWWQSTGNNFNCGKIVGEDLCLWWAAMTIDDNQQWIMPTPSKSSEKIYVRGRRRINENQLAILQLWQNCQWKSMTVVGGDDNRWQSTMINANSVQIVREDLCPWRVVTTINDNQLWIMPTLSKLLGKIYVHGGRWWQLMTINYE